MRTASRREVKPNILKSLLGFVPQTPLASSRETRPTQWLPNLHLLSYCSVANYNSQKNPEEPGVT
ncbi:hypothetical protein [Nostoc sp. 'Lobaria pulmonaria (5183) cyanobiont']|uniref:hypothetical protein n=1 Tax=Nostoc sp. 'Lobaria pulmonaria (5183) cyanobiont' TaxID=1618022 RepID=UPI00131A0EDA|nr:hypothetical protein [Nostoc sp. 'Lobaria pulmonaria (5183) cyanobiont']